MLKIHKIKQNIGEKLDKSKMNRNKKMEIK